MGNVEHVMTTDYAEPLKRAWEACPLCDGSRDVIATDSRKGTAWEERCDWVGHAALLEMVGAVHVKGCKCDRSFKIKCQNERRRLRASIGVSND